MDTRYPRYTKKGKKDDSKIQILTSWPQAREGRQARGIQEDNRKTVKAIRVFKKAD